MVVINTRLSYYNRVFESHGFKSILQLDIFFFSYIQNEQLIGEIKDEVYNMGKVRCVELQNNKHVMVCALIDRVDRMDDFESQLCKMIYCKFQYGTDNLIDKTEQELSEMLVIAEEIAERHCGYPNSIESHCSASRAMAIRKNQLSFKCDDNEQNGCEDCYYCDVSFPCPQSYNTWIARDLSKEKCKDGSLRYGFIKEMLDLYIKPDENLKLFYPEGTFDDKYLEQAEPDYDNSLERYYNEFADEDEDDFDLGM